MIVLERVAAAVAEAAQAGRPVVSGRVAEVRGLSVRVRGLAARVGDVVTVGAVPAEVVAVSLDDREPVATCLPLGELAGIAAGDAVRSTGAPLQVRVGAELLGQVLDGLGRPLDGSLLPAGLPLVGLDAAPPDALTRSRVDTPLPTGVRALDTLTPVGRGTGIITCLQHTS